ncbi:MAG: hypothetical protein N3D74_06040 [Caldisericia bacterium]|nr:hypothetical protein [Caldisericia bacterium]
MDTFKIFIGLIGLVSLIISIYFLISTLIRFFKKKESFKNLISSFLTFFILLLISIIFVLIFSLLQTFSRFSYEEKIGEVYAVKNNEIINIIYTDIKNNKKYVFDLKGDQWMIEGEILVFDKWLRWLGAESYFRITRFSGRFTKEKDIPQEIYEINKDNSFWEFILKNYEKLPFVDTAYGIGAFQYPGYNFEIFIDDTGFIIRKSKN